MKKALFFGLVFSLFTIGLISSGVATHANAKDTINIGFIGPLTGPAAYIGLDSLRGAEVAAWEANQRGGITIGDKKYLVRIASHDDEMVAARSVAGLRSLKDRHNIPVAINNLSGTIMALLEVNEEIDVLVGGFFRNPAATVQGNKLVLRHQVAMTEDNSLLARWAVEHMAPKKVAILADVSDFGRGLSKVWLEEFEDLDVDVVAQEWFDQTRETDLRNQLIKIRARRPDMIFVAAYDEGSAAARNQGMELGLNVPYIFTLGLQTRGIELIGKERLEGCARLMQHDVMKPTPPGVINYNKIYAELAKKNNWPTNPGAYGGNVYEFAWTVMLSMEEAGSLEPRKIRAAAPKVFPLPDEQFYIGVVGYQETGNGIMKKRLGVFRDGELTPVD